MTIQTRVFGIAVFLLAASSALLIGCSKRSGPATTADLQTVTNLVQSVTTNRILRVQQVDVETGRLIVFTDSGSGQEAHYLIERDGRDWRITSSVVK